MARHEILTSAANPLLKDVRRAIARGGLTEDGYFVAEGFHLIEEAVRSDLEVKVVLAAESAFDRLRVPSAMRVAVTGDTLFQKLGDTESSQGVIALVKAPSWTLDQALRGCSLIVVLDALQDPGNAGAIVRAAEAFAATGVLFTKGTVSPYNPKTLRASAGSLFRVPFVHQLDGMQVRSAFEQNKIAVYAAMPGAALAPEAMNFTQRCALVIGSEAHGVSEALRRGAVCVSIPTAQVESLNAAVAAGILLYEAQRQRRRP
jgi:RNA methyltransferase, TrmH family